MADEAYTSRNTTRLDVEETVKSIDYRICE